MIDKDTRNAARDETAEAFKHFADNLRRKSETCPSEATGKVLRAVSLEARRTALHLRVKWR